MTASRSSPGASPGSSRSHAAKKPGSGHIRSGGSHPRRRSTRACNKADAFDSSDLGIHAGPDEFLWQLGVHCRAAVIAAGSPPGVEERISCRMRSRSVGHVSKDPIVRPFFLAVAQAAPKVAPGCEPDVLDERGSGSVCTSALAVPDSLREVALWEVAVFGMGPPGSDLHWFVSVPRRHLCFAPHRGHE